jgi:hypothetical protein
MAELRAQLAKVDGDAPGSVSAAREVEWLRAIGAAIQSADVPAERSELVHAIYERIIVAGPSSSPPTSPRRPTSTALRWRCRRWLWRARQVLGAR